MAIAPIVLMDAQDTPVEHTFSPIGELNGSSYEYFVERVNGRPDLAREIRVRLRNPSRPGQPYRVDYTVIDLRTMTNADGKEVIDVMNRHDGTYTLAPDSTVADRKNISEYVKGLHSDATFISVVNDLIELS